MKYGEVFSTSWKIVWKFKALWIFGILSSCMRNAGSGASSSGGSGGGSSSFFTPPGMHTSHNASFLVQPGHWLQLLQLRLNEQPWLIAILIIALFTFISALIVISLIAGTIGRVGVARGAWLADDGRQKLGFSYLLTESWPYFWRVLLLLLMVGLAALILISLLVIPVVLLTIISFGLIWLLLIPLLLPLGLLFIILALAINALVEEAVIAIVGENLGVFAALERAWRLLWEKPFPQLLISFLLGLLKMAVGIVLALPLFLIMLPIIFALMFQSDAATAIGAILSGGSFLIYLPFILLVSAILYAYLGTVWAVTFRRLTGCENKMAQVKAGG